jgi:hypothetical protein
MAPLLLITRIDMQLAKRHEIGMELIQGAALALLVVFIYHYFGPSASTPPRPEVFAVLTISFLLVVGTVNRPRQPKVPVAPLETLSKAQMKALTEKLDEADWAQLNKVVSGIYNQLGCDPSDHANAEGEHNFSFVIERAGQKMAVMCKPWNQREVTSPEIIEFCTEIKQAGIAQGVFVTLRPCTAPALKVAETLGIDIVNQEALLQLLTASGENYRAELLSDLENGRKACPSCDNDMVLRTSTKGLGAGEQFWECSKAPECRCTEPH